jgi:hypothetical protein
VNGAIANPGEQGRFTFRGTPGQRLYYDALEGDFDSIGVHLVSPSGLTVQINGNSASDIGPFTLIEDGLYTLVIDGNGATTGNYAFRLLEVSKQPMLPFDLQSEFWIRFQLAGFPPGRARARLFLVVWAPTAGNSGFMGS